MIGRISETTGCVGTVVCGVVKGHSLNQQFCCECDSNMKTNSAYG